MDSHVTNHETSYFGLDESEPTHFHIATFTIGQAMLLKFRGAENAT